MGKNYAKVIRLMKIRNTFVFIRATLTFRISKRLHSKGRDKTRVKMTRKKWEDKFATKDNIRFMAIKVQELEKRIRKIELQKIGGIEK